ncbi:hypothetical protein ACLMJK_006985 [Lecanora helva]
MGRSRVMSFMTAFAAPRSPTSTSFSGPQNLPSKEDITTSADAKHVAAPARDSPTPPRTRGERSNSIRPMSMVQTYQPPTMEIAQDTIPELQNIFTLLNSHGNKLYQEGYFLKLNDLDTNGRPNNDRSWTESFAQLVGTILSLWDASALDVAGQDGEVAPSFINLADASIKMIETLPTRSQDVQPLQNVLSISTAGKNRYLLHFNSLHSLTQWTAAIRLAMFEHATLQEAYTGSLIAGKGKLLNNIKVIMDRTRIRNEDWARVRFGAGTPWRRCWCVITPPDEKDFQKQQKLAKKKSAYERTAPLKGNIKFYDTKKTKKAQPIATINDAYSAYAIYPQSKPLIDQSTLVKIEGSITIHSTPETTTDGFVFAMPEVHPAVTGFEMMLRYLFPVYDVFALYGRPTRLIADTLDTRGLMFALPQERRYGYLEILDVAGLIHETGSQSWSDREWRKRMKDLTSQRMARMTTNGRPRSRANSYRGYRNSLPSRAGTLRYEDGASICSTPSLHDGVPPMPPPHSDSAPPTENGPFPPPRPIARHQRSFSEAIPASTPPRQKSQRYGPEQNYTPSRLSHERSRPSFEGQFSSQLSLEQNTPSPPFKGRPSYEQQGPPPFVGSRQPSEPGAPPPPAHGVPIGMAARNPQLQKYTNGLGGHSERSSSESERRFGGIDEADPQEIRQELRPAPPPSQVAAPPAFSHQPGAKPQKRPGINPEMRRANSRLSITTLSQLAEAGQAGTGGTAAAGAAAAWRSNSQRSLSGMSSEDQGPRGVNHIARNDGNTADRSSPSEGLVVAKSRKPPLLHNESSWSDGSGSGSGSGPYYKDKPLMSSYDLMSPPNPSSRAVSPLAQSTTISPPTKLEDERHYKPQPMPTQLPAQLQRTNTSYSISRKPVPSRNSVVAGEIPPPDSPPLRPKSSLDSLNDQYIDEEALSQVLLQQHALSMTSESQAGFHDEESLYDNDSNVSPDYASTRKSTETKQSRPSVDRPRRGVLKTVGTVEPVQKEVQVGDMHYRPGATPEPLNPDIPVVDFGPTQAFNPAENSNSRPNTSGTLMQPSLERAKTPSPGLPEVPKAPSPRAESPSVLQRSSLIYPSDHPNHFHERANGPHERTPSRNLATPEPQLRPRSAADDDNRRSVAWSPGAMIGGGSPGNRRSITPEQFVQQRAAANRITPIYAHGRQGSGSPTPPTFSRNSSGEWPLQQKRQSSYTTDLPSRPHSRAASTLLNGSGDYTAHLSAREQEHVARVTGAPLINVAGNNNKNSSPQGGGLIGAIEAREREKKEAKRGLGGQMVQNAIAQRQQHNQGLQQRRQSYQVPSPPYAVPGQFPPSPTLHHHISPGQQQYYAPQQQPHIQYQQYPQQQQQQWTPPGMQQQHGSYSPQRTSPYQAQPQQYQQYGQGQQPYYGPYFGNGQSQH